MQLCASLFLFVVIITAQHVSQTTQYMPNCNSTVTKYINPHYNILQCVTER